MSDQKMTDESTDQEKFDRAMEIARDAAIGVVAKARQHADIAPELVGLGFVQAGICLAIQARGPGYAAKRLRALLDGIENPVVPWSN